MEKNRRPIAESTNSRWVQRDLLGAYLELAVALLGRFENGGIRPVTREQIAKPSQRCRIAKELNLLSHGPVSKGAERSRSELHEAVVNRT